MEIALRYLHFISVFAIVSTLVAEHLLLKPKLTREEVKRIGRIDMVYGLAALSLLAAGLTLWLSGVGKPSVFYSQNWIFHTKLGLYMMVGILSIYPTVYFIRESRKQEAKLDVPPIIIWLVRLEILLVFIIPLLAGLMARGIGFYGN